MLDVFLARLLLACRGIWCFVECRATVETFIRLCSNMLAYGCGVRNSMHISLASLFFSLNQLRNFGFPVFPVTYTFFSYMKLRACTFQCNHTVYISLSVGNATEEKITTLDQPINCHSILHRHQTNGHECTFIISVLFLWGVWCEFPVTQGDGNVHIFTCIWNHP